MAQKRIGLSVFLLKQSQVSVFQKELVSLLTTRLELANNLDGEFFPLAGQPKQPAWVDALRPLLQQLPARQGDAILTLWRATHDRAVGQSPPLHLREANAGMIGWLERCQANGWRLIKDNVCIADRAVDPAAARP